MVTALPFWKKTPAIAGSKARPSGADCQFDSSCMSTSSRLDTRGRNKSSVEDRMEFRASDTESDKVELRRKFDGLVEPSAKVAAWDGPRWRRLVTPGGLLLSLLRLALLLSVKEVRGEDEGDDGRGGSVMVNLGSRSATRDHRAAIRGKSVKRTIRNRPIPLEQEFVHRACE